MPRRTYEVDDIHCDSCSRTLRRALSDLGSVTDVQTDPANNRVVVTFSDLPEQAITDQLADAGFGVRKTIAEDEPGPGNTKGPGNRRSRYGLLILGIAVIALAGYAGYALYPRFDLPALEGAGLPALAAGAGIASFFAPCSFPLLVLQQACRWGRIGWK